MRPGRWLVLALIAAPFMGHSTASAIVLTYATDMDGASESPPNVTPGIGFAQLDYDNVAHTMRIQASFNSLIGTTTMAHIHAPTAVPFTATAGVSTQLPSFAGFPLGVTAGTMDTTFDMTLAATWNSSYITANGGTTAGAEAAFASHLAQGRAYFNIHSTFDGSGEIRGFFILVPEPTTFGLATVSALALVFASRRARKA